MPGPIQPDEVGPRRSAQIPEEVFEVFNSLITANWNGRSAVVRQDVAIRRLLKEIDGLTTERIFEEHLLDVEEAYRAQGWTVIYDKPAYNEDYPATFKFSKPSK